MSLYGKIKRYFFTLFATLILFLSSCFMYAQVKLPDWEVGLTSVGGVGDQVPFWVISNRQGKFLPEKYAGSMDFGLFAQRDTGRIVDYEYGLEGFGRLSSDGDAWLHQVYAGVTLYDLVRFRAGRWGEIVGSRQPSISSGSIIWSGNARPLPKVEIGTPGYIDVPYLHGYAEVSGLLSHGWFEEGRFASDVWLHHKNFYVRLGGDLPVNIYYGFNHYAQWGGSSPRQEEPYPSDFKAYKKVFMIKHGDPEEPGTPVGWVQNRFGNHIGSRNYGIDVNLDNFSAGIYQQDVFEDNSGYSRKNFPDGLWGAWLRFPERDRTLQAVVYEFLQTTDQSGPYHDLDGIELGGNDNYFNHGHYSSGWTYHQYTIGTPLITSSILNDPPLNDPPLNDPPVDRISNNRVIAHHIGFEGHVTGNISYRNFFTFSRNFGTFNNPFSERRDQFSWMIELSGPLRVFDLDAAVTLAADYGDMYGNNLGVVFSLRKSGGFWW